MGGSADAPDYKGAAEAEAESSTLNTGRQTWANRPNQYTPWGSTEWDAQQVYDPTLDDYVTRWSQYDTINPELQASLDSELALQTGRSDLAGGMLGRVEDEFSEPMDWDKFGDLTGVDPLQTMTDSTQWDSRAEQNAMDMSRRNLDPQFADERDQLEIKMRGQGLAPGDQGWDAQIDGLDARKTDAYQNAMNNAIATSGSEATRLQGMEKSQLGYNQDSLFRQADYSNQLRQQAITEDMTRRGYSLNEINAIISGQQVDNPEFQDFSNASKADTTKYLEAESSQANYNQAESQALMQGVTSIAGSAASAYTGGMLGG